MKLPKTGLLPTPTPQLLLKSLFIQVAGNGRLTRELLEHRAQSSTPDEHTGQAQSSDGSVARSKQESSVPSAHPLWFQLAEFYFPESIHCSPAACWLSQAQASLNAEDIKTTKLPEFVILALEKASSQSLRVRNTWHPPVAKRRQPVRRRQNLTRNRAGLSSKAVQLRPHMRCVVRNGLLTTTDSKTNKGRRGAL